RNVPSKKLFVPISTAQQVDLRSIVFERVITKSAAQDQPEAQILEFVVLEIRKTITKPFRIYVAIVTRPAAYDVGCRLRNTAGAVFGIERCRVDGRFVARRLSSQCKTGGQVQ